MRIAGLQKLTLLDFPGKTAATVFTPGCNFRCPFCHNEALVVDPAGNAAEDVSLEQFFAFLAKRKGLLDGVCITGGEPLLQPDLAAFCKRVHDEGFSVKLDTTGSFPDRLRALAETGNVDFVAMDVKNAPGRYAETAGVPGFGVDAVQASLDFLRAGTVPYELRTTVMRELHTADDLRAIAHWIADGCGNASNKPAATPAWFLQSYLDAESVLAGPGRFHAWNPNDLRALLPELQAIAPRTHLRGID